MAHDKRYLILLTTYLAALLLFSSRFYLATEDYEAVVAVRLIGQGIPVGKNTGWPYMPLTPYLFYFHSLIFGDGILGFRILTAGFLVASVVPIYLSLRYLCSPFIAFALTIFSFSLVTFPHPRLEYYIEGALVSFSIFFAASSIRSGKQKKVFLAAIFLFVAFASRGYPNTGLLVILLPAALVIVRQLSKNDQSDISRKNDQSDISQARFELHPWSTRAWVWLGLAVPCFIFMIISLRRVVYRISFIEYASLLGVAHLRSFHDHRVRISIVLLGILIIIFAATRLSRNSQRLDTQWMESTYPRWSLVTSQILVPFFICAILLLVTLYMMGQPVQHIYFFLFPVDIILDHMNQLKSGRSYVVPLWAFLSVAIMFLSSKYGLALRQTTLALFFVLLLPVAFARSFPGFNMLYFISFVLAIFIAILVPATASLLFKRHESISARLQHSLAVFFLMYAFASNSFLLLKVQLMDLRSGNVDRIHRNPVDGIWIEKDVIKFFEDVDHSLRSMKAHGESIAFFSNRYLNYVPLLYGYRDALAGQNLIMGLGKVWSYDDVLRIEAKKVESRWNRDRVVNTWRQTAAHAVETARANVIVMSLYDTKAAKQVLTPSSDPFREYLRENFFISKIIEPSMELHRRSSFSEGAIILTRVNP